MKDVLQQLLLFGAETALVVVAVLIVLFALAYLLARNKVRPQLEIQKLNNRYRTMRRALQQHLLGKKELKAYLKNEKQQDKQKEKKNKGKEPANEAGKARPRVFVLDFEGDIRASAVNSLREEITAVLQVATESDEVVIRLESPGGLVHSYGLASSQLQRVKDRRIPLTVCVDKVAASGGYMMACIADRILAAPFAVVGSIGVIASVPNFHRVLEKHNVDYREVTAGDYKRTISMFGEITHQGLEKFKEQVQETHKLFKQFVHEHRPQLDVQKIATGEVWYGTQALPLKLVDELRTSDDYLLSRSEQADLFRVRYHERKKLAEKISERMTDSLFRAIYRLWTEVVTARL